MSDRKPFTDQEEECMRAIVRAWNTYTELPVIHPSAEADFLFHIHGLQDILMGRVCARDYPEYFINKSKPQSNEDKGDTR